MEPVRLAALHSTYSTLQLIPVKLIQPVCRLVVPVVCNALAVSIYGMENAQKHVRRLHLPI